MHPRALAVADAADRIHERAPYISCREPPALQTSRALLATAEYARRVDRKGHNWDREDGDDRCWNAASTESSDTKNVLLAVQTSAMPVTDATDPIHERAAHVSMGEAPALEPSNTLATAEHASQVDGQLGPEEGSGRSSEEKADAVLFALLMPLSHPAALCVFFSEKASYFPFYPTTFDISSKRRAQHDTATGRRAGFRDLDLYSAQETGEEMEFEISSAGFAECSQQSQADLHPFRTLR